MSKPNDKPSHLDTDALPAAPEERLLSVHESELQRKAPGRYRLVMATPATEEPMVIVTKASWSIH